MIAADMHVTNSGENVDFSPSRENITKLLFNECTFIHNNSGK